MTAWRPASRVRARRVGDEVILLNLDSMLYFHLDEVGAFIWERLEAGESPDRITEAMTQAFAVDAATARRDLDALVASLAEAGLVVEG